MFNKIIKSYQNNFKSSFGAYSYMYFNQTIPEIFILSTDNTFDFQTKSDHLDEILKSASSFDDLFNKFNNLSDDYFDSLNPPYSENKVSKERILKEIENFKHLDINWEDSSWDFLETIIEFNNLSEFIEDKEDILFKMNLLKKEFNLSNLTLNYNFHPFEFLNDFQNSAYSFCNTLGINKKQIGLNTLKLSYKTNYGDFTGCNITSNGIIYDHIFLNKLGVFAHEWMHFIDHALGYSNYSITELYNTLNPSKDEKLFLSYATLTPLKNYREIIKTKDLNNDIISQDEFANAISNFSFFFSLYAIDPKNMPENFHDIAYNFYDKLMESEDIELTYNEMEDQFKTLLSEDKTYPERYFSFIKAQSLILKEEIEYNKFYHFANASDKYLGEDDYSLSTSETFARSFETFLYDKSESKCGFLLDNYNSDLYPQQHMRDNLNNFWESAWSALKEKLNLILLREKNEHLSKFYLHNINFNTNLENFRNNLGKEKRDHGKPSP